LSLPFIYSLGVRDTTISEFAVHILLDPAVVLSGNATIRAVAKVCKLTSLLACRATVLFVSLEKATKCDVSHWIPPVGCFTSRSFRQVSSFLGKGRCPLLFLSDSLPGMSSHFRGGFHPARFQLPESATFRKECASYKVQLHLVYAMPVASRGKVP